MTEHPFEKMMRGGGHDHAALTAARFEDGRVRYLLRALGQAAAEPRLLARRRRQAGEGLLTFALFAAEFPAFPLDLAAHRCPRPLHLEPSCFLPSLLRSFEKTPLYKQYLLALEARQRRPRPLTLVLDRKGLRHGLALHPPLGSVAVAGAYVGFAGTLPGGAALRLELRPYDLLVAALAAAGWGARLAAGL